MASANLKRAEMATAQVRVAEQDRRKSSRNASNKTSSRKASNKTTAEPPFAVAETLNRTVHQAHAAVDVVVQGLTADAQDGDGPAPTGAATGDGPAWTAEAEARVARLPEFVRPMVRQGIEQYARDRGYDRVDERVLDEAREAMGV